LQALDWLLMMTAGRLVKLRTVVIFEQTVADIKARPKCFITLTIIKKFTIRKSSATYNNHKKRIKMRITIDASIKTQVIDGFNRQLIVFTPKVSLGRGVYGEMVFPSYDAFADDFEDCQTKRDAAMANAEKTMASFLACPSRFSN
jgi:hypothetical protein